MAKNKLSVATETEPTTITYRQVLEANAIIGKFTSPKGFPTDAMFEIHFVRFNFIV